MVGWDGFSRPIVCFVTQPEDWWARFPQTGGALADHVHMRLFAAIVPPEEARKELAEVVRAAGPDTPELAAVPTAEMLIPVTGFGNVSQRDAVQLISKLTRAAASWPRPDLRFAGSAALEWPGRQDLQRSAFPRHGAVLISRFSGCSGCAGPGTRTAGPRPG